MEALDIFHLTLSVCIALVTIFLSMTLIYLMFILRDISKIAERAENLLEKIDTFITRPILLTKSIIEFVTPFIQRAETTFRKKGK